MTNQPKDYGNYLQSLDQAHLLGSQDMEDALYRDIAEASPEEQLNFTQQQWFVKLETVKYAENNVYVIIGNGQRWWVMTTRGLLKFPNSTWHFEHMPVAVHPLFIEDSTVSKLTLPFIIVTFRNDGQRGLFLIDEQWCSSVSDSDGRKYFDTEWECKVLAQTYLVQFQVWMWGAMHQHNNPTNSLH